MLILVNLVFGFTLQEDFKPAPIAVCGFAPQETFKNPIKVNPVSVFMRDATNAMS